MSLGMVNVSCQPISGERKVYNSVNFKGNRDFGGYFDEDQQCVNDLKDIANSSSVPSFTKKLTNLGIIMGSSVLGFYMFKKLIPNVCDTMKKVVLSILPKDSKIGKPVYDFVEKSIQDIKRPFIFIDKKLFSQLTKMAEVPEDSIKKAIGSKGLEFREKFLTIAGRSKEILTDTIAVASGFSTGAQTAQEIYQKNRGEDK